MVIQLLGWFSTVLVALGFLVNSRKNHILAFIFWIIADLGWIIYDYHIQNWSHATLAFFIVVINFYGFYNHKFKGKIDSIKTKLTEEYSSGKYVVFNIISDKMSDNLPEHIANQIDWDQDNDYCLLEPEIYSKLEDWAFSKGYKEGEDWVRIEN